MKNTEYANVNDCKNLAAALDIIGFNTQPRPEHSLAAYSPDLEHAKYYGRSIFVSPARSLKQWSHPVQGNTTHTMESP